MKFVLASHNRAKLEEMRFILEEMNVEVVSQSDLGLNLEPEETGETFFDNAYIKAKAVMEASGLPAIADDSGLCVNWLNGGPGVYSARYGGLSDDKARNDLLMEMMQGSTDRSASFHSTVVCAFPNGDIVSAAGECSGIITYAPRGENGFGYDPLFFVPMVKKTFAQLSPEEKSLISHRGNALRSFAVELKKYLEKNGYGFDE